MIDKETVEKFKNLYMEKFNISLSDEEATQMSTDLINLMKILVEPDERSEDETIPTRA